MIHHININSIDEDWREGPISVLRCYHSITKRSGGGIFYKVGVYLNTPWGSGSVTFVDDRFWSDYTGMVEILLKHGFKKSIARAIAQFARTYIEDKT